MKKSLLLTPLLATLFGCGTMSGRLGDLPPVADRNTAAKVVVVRISDLVGAANGYTIAFNGKDLAGIGSGEHAEFLVTPGEHYIAVKCFGGFSPTWKEESLKFIANVSQSNFFLVRPNSRCASIKSATEEEAQKHLPDSQAVNLDKLVKP
ncbi:hypothetical protein GCM10007907_39710 [Chitinimonas prasina]|uniref:PEGA domain-containing protein n=1 Tax=Chitinimonas prasina TaxID=1434937 RepID=A0ABQ5YPB3_9NEIS|nr:hypothetical protein [Chitinimonas prasina]GLR15181.1 hypothetical protein GCM10007907_39710 [Chitinimonas prasina]